MKVKEEGTGLATGQEAAVPVALNKWVLNCISTVKCNYN